MVQHIKSTFSIPVEMDRTRTKGTLEVEFASSSNEYYGMTLLFDDECRIRFSVRKVEIEALVQANKVKV